MASLFADGVPSDHESRCAIIDSWPSDDIVLEQLLDDVDDSLMPLLEDLESTLEEYIDDHRLTRDSL